MPKLEQNLRLERCPHCNVANPNLFKQHVLETYNSSNTLKRVWFIYTCGTCGGVVTAWSTKGVNDEVIEIFPSPKEIDNDIPEKPRAYLKQAIESIHAPAGAVMLAASAVDAMLKIKGYSEGNLYNRIEKAAQEHVITPAMSLWAHEVRLDANDQRHADERSSLPDPNDAQKVIDFSMAFAEFMFVLPNRIQKGLSKKANE
jgi:hypothetical protein